MNLPRPALPFQFDASVGPGLGGQFKAAPEDFLVEEIPAYEPSGVGEHLYLWVEKRGVSHDLLIQQLARQLRLPRDSIGTAGIKDRHAITRQWISVPRTAQPQLDAFRMEGVQFLTVSRHNNKLRTGHLRGNRFTIRLRDRTPGIDPSPRVERLRKEGLLNYYGPQRFGHDGQNLELGLAHLRGDKGPRLPPFLRKLALSAVQSALFNAVLAERFRAGIHRTVLLGDVLMRWPAGGLFTTTDPTTDQPRHDARELVIGGPMPGEKMFPAAGTAAERETAILQEVAGPELLAALARQLPGTRRHTTIYCDDLNVQVTDAEAIITVTLPAGTYATVLLRELMQSDGVVMDEL
ncbi:MAG: tRNA pseudouridine(13) synthase TruD [Gemmataceae bacterium]